MCLSLNFKKVKNSGLTLVEVIFVSAVVGIILATVSLAFRGSFDSWSVGNRRSELIQKARVALNIMTREIRTASNFGGGSDNANLYYTDGSGTFRRFQIDIGNQTLRFGQVGSLDDFVTPIEVGSSFTYYRDDGVTTTTVPSEIRSVLITLVISDSDGTVNNITVSSRVKRRMGGNMYIWPKYSLDRQNLGITYEILNPNYLVNRWTIRLDCRFQHSSPIVADNTVYIGCSDRRTVYALDAGDGSTRWSSSVSLGDISSAPTIDGNIVYVAAAGGVYRFNKDNGNPLGSTSLDDNVNHSSPVIYGNYLYIGAGRYVYKISKNTGARAWKSVELDGNVDYSTPAIFGNILYIGAGQSLEALYLSNGTRVWGGGSGGDDIQYVDGSRSDPANRSLQFDIINTSSNPITLTSLMAQYSGGALYSRIFWNGTRIWRGGPNGSGMTTIFDSARTINNGETVTMLINFNRRITSVEFTITFSDGSVIVVPPMGVGGGGDFDTSPSVFGGVVYIGNDDRRVYAYDAITGSNLWRTDRLADSVLGSPAVSNDGRFIYAGAGRRVYKIRTSNGSQVWRTANLDQNIESALVLSGNYIYVSSGPYLYAINDTNGNSDWRSAQLSGNTQYSSPAIANGLIYVGDSSRRVNAYGL